MGVQGMKFSRALLATLAYLVLLLATYYVHVRWFRVDVVFYSVLFDVALAAFLAAIALFGFPWFRVFNPFEKGQLLSAWLMLGYMYAISVPTVIDRSLSFYILEKIQQQGGGVRMDKFEEIFTKGYAQEHQLVAVRLTEQQSSGTVVIGGGCVRLTQRGHRLAHFSRWFRKYLLPRQRLLMGTYTDELTDPFRRSAVGSDAGCQ